MALEIKLCRSDNTPWGFRLVGGTDFEYPITVSKVLESSLAEHSGLLDGDVIIDVNERPASRLTHEGAHDVIMNAGNQCVLRVVRAEEYRNPMNAEPEDYEPAPAIIQGFTPITTPLGHEVPDNRTRGCESPFTLSTKPYRPFSTEPIIGIPPLEEPIILDPKYQDDFTKIELKDFEPDTIFKLEKSNVKYENSSAISSKLTQNSFSENKSVQFSGILQNGFSGNHNIDIDVKKIEESARCLVNENLSEAFNVSKEINHEIAFAQHINGKNVEIDQNIRNECDNDIFKNNICANQNSVISEIDESVNNFTEELCFKSLEMNSKMCNQEHENISLKKIAKDSIIAGINKHRQSEMKECDAVPQFKSYKDSKSSQVSQSESSQVLRSESKQFSQCFLEENGVSNREMASDEETSQAKKSEQISMKKFKEDITIVNENVTSSASEQCQESSEESISAKTKDIIQIFESLNQSSIPDTSIKKSNRNSVCVSEFTQNSMDSKIEKEKYTTAKLLNESAKLRSQTIPGLQGTTYSTHNYDLLLKTFFIHLTDVMVALSRLLMSDQSLSRSVSPMPPTKKEFGIQKTTKIVQEQNIASEHQSRLSQFQKNSEKISVNRIETARNNKNKISSTESERKETNITSAEVTSNVSKKSELDAKIDVILRQKDPLEWLAETDERNSSRLRGEDLGNQGGVIMWKGHADLISQKDLRGSMDLDEKESAMSELMVNTAKEEIETKDTSQSQVGHSTTDIVKELNDMESIQETSKQITEVDATKIEKSVEIHKGISEMIEAGAEAIEISEGIPESNESEMEKVQICDEIIGMNETKAEPLKVSKEISILNESKIEEGHICNEISEINKTKAETLEVSKEISVMNLSNIEKVHIGNEISEINESKAEAIEVSKEISVMNVSPIEKVHICNEISEINETKAEAIEVSKEISVMNVSNIEKVHICNEISEINETKAEVLEISGINESKIEEVLISNELSVGEANHKVCPNSSEVLNQNKTEICSNIFETNETKIKSSHVSDEFFEIKEINIGKVVKGNSEESETKIKENSDIKSDFTEIVQKSTASDENGVEVVQEEIIISEKDEKSVSEQIVNQIGVFSETEIEHKLVESTLSDAIQVREKSESEIENETDQYIPAPQTPLTDEYIFRLELKLVESRSPSKSPIRVAKKPPQPKPVTQHEDPHVVKKPKLKASIETKIETLHSSTNNRDSESSKCAEKNLGIEPPSTLTISSNTENSSCMAINSNTTPGSLNIETPFSLKNPSIINSSLSTASNTDTTTNTTAHSNTDIRSTAADSNTDIGSTAADSNTDIGSTAADLRIDTALRTSDSPSANIPMSTPTSSTYPQHETVQLTKGSGIVEQPISTTTNSSADTLSNSETNSSTPSTLDTNPNINTAVSTDLSTATALKTETTLCAATNLSTETASNTSTTSSTNIALSTATTLSTTQQHEKAQIAEDIGIVDQQLPGKESRKQSLANGYVVSPVNTAQNIEDVVNGLDVQESLVTEDSHTTPVELDDKNKSDNNKEILIVDQKVVENRNEDDIGKPGLSDEQIATLISGESELLKGQHIIGLSKVLASHMSRELDEDDDSSINFKKMKPQIDALKDSEVLKVLNEEILKTKEEKKKEERKYTTFLQRPNRPIPLSGNLWYNQPPPHEKYKVKIVKQPKPRIAPDSPKNYETGLLPWEQRKLNEPPPPPIEIEDPILIPEEGPEYLEALDNLPESAVPDLEDTGLPPPPEPVLKEEDYSERTEDLEFHTEGDTGDELEDLSEAQTEEEKLEMEQNKMVKDVLCNIEDAIDPNMSIEEQLAVMHSQLLALSQLPAAIQHTLEAVTQQLSKIVPHNTKVEEEPESKIEQIEVKVDQGETTDSESHPTGESGTQPAVIEEVLVVATPEQKVTEEIVQIEQKDQSNMIKTEPDVKNDQERTIDQSKRELIAELELEHQQRQVKQRPTARVGRPKPVFGPLVPQERPMILPGGRKWRRPEDAYNDDFIAETLTAQAEMLQGRAKGLPYESVRLPYDQRVNFMKYEKPEKSLDYLKDSSVYKLVHETDVPGRGLEVRPAMVLSESEFREKCRSVTPSNERPQVQEEHLDIPQQLQP